jgi:hypothetical protein
MSFTGRKPYRDTTEETFTHHGPLLEFSGIEENTYHSVSVEIGVGVILFAGVFDQFVWCMLGHTVTTRTKGGSSACSGGAQRSSSPVY